MLSDCKSDSENQITTKTQHRTILLTSGVVAERHKQATTGFIHRRSHQESPSRRRLRDGNLMRKRVTHKIREWKKDTKP